MTGRWTRWIWGTHPRRTLIRALGLGLLVYLLCHYLLRPARVEGISMQPTLRDGSLRVINLLRYAHRAPARGDIVAIAMPGGRAMYLKRVLATPGERVEFRAGALWVNAQPVAEPYLSAPAGWNMSPVDLGPDEYFVCGDHRGMPMAEHRLGVVRRSDIAGGLLW